MKKSTLVLAIVSLALLAPFGLAQEKGGRPQSIRARDFHRRHALERG